MSESADAVEMEDAQDAAASVSEGAGVDAMGECGITNSRIMIVIWEIHVGDHISRHEL